MHNSLNSAAHYNIVFCSVRDAVRVFRCLFSSLFLTIFELNYSFKRKYLLLCTRAAELALLCDETSSQPQFVLSSF